jgi:S1-C subfamily serine protease
MTAALSDLLGFHTGVAVTWVAADGPAGGRLQVADVVHAADGQLLSTVEHWDRHLADLDTAPTVLKVWRERQSIDVALTPVASAAAEAPVAPARRVPGITARLAAGTGSEVTAVQSGSLAEAAGLRAGDVVTRIGSLTAPSPAQIRDALGAADGRPVLVAITRSGQHHLMVITP